MSIAREYPTNDYLHSLYSTVSRKRSALVTIQGRSGLKSQKIKLQHLSDFFFNGTLVMVTACISPHCVESSNKLKVGNNMSVTHTCSILF